MSIRHFRRQLQILAADLKYVPINPIRKVRLVSRDVTFQHLVLNVRCAK
jgi:hypothetical protein